MISFIAGLISCLTPLVFPYIIICSISFSKLSTTKGQHVFNVFVFSFIIITSYITISFYTESAEAILVLIKYLKETGITLNIGLILFALWIIGFFKDKDSNNTIFKMDRTTYA